MSDEHINAKLIARRGLSRKFPNNTSGGVRGSQFGELVTLEAGSARHVMSDQATYFVGHNTTNDAATTIASHADPELVDVDATMTKPFIHMRVAASSLNRIYLDYIELEITAAATGGTGDCWAAQLDTGATRVTSGGTALTYVNTNMQSTASPDLAILAGAVVTGAESPNVRNLGFGQTRKAVSIIGDRYQFRFGGEPSSGDNVAATVASRHLINLGPVILGPTDQLLLAIYPSTDDQTVGPVFKVRCAWWEY